MSKQYFRKPAEIIQDPRFRSADLKYKYIFDILCEVVCYKDTEFAIGHKKVIVKSGQYCTSLDQFTEICNRGVTKKKDKVDRDTVRRAFQFFIKCRFLSHEVLHEMQYKKSVYTILWDGYSETSTTRETTRNATGSAQEPHNNKDRSIDKVDILDPIDIEEANIAKEAKSANPLFLKKREEEGKVFHSFRESIDKRNGQLKAENKDLEINVSNQVLLRWINAHGIDKFTRNFIEITSRWYGSKTKKIKNFQRTMEDALKKDYAGEKDRAFKNTKYFESFSKENSCKDFVVLSTVLKHLKTEFSIRLDSDEVKFKEFIHTNYQKEVACE